MNFDTDLMPGCEHRDWLLCVHPNNRFGREKRKDDGRVLVWLGKGHPRANATGWQYRYRLVVEFATGRDIPPAHHVHHVNGKVDDDRIENLRVLTISQHSKLEAISRPPTPRDKKGRFAVAA